MDKKVYDSILQSAQSGTFDVIHSGTPCNTWSSAREIEFRKPGDPRTPRTRACPGDDQVQLTQREVGQRDEQTIKFEEL